MDYLQDISLDDPRAGDLYDELPLWSAPFGLRLLERAPLAPGLTILDVGAGTGFLALELAQRCGPGTTVFAVDPWKAAMHRLRWKVKRLGLANVILLEQDAATLDLPGESVDLIVSNLGLHNFENAEAVLQTCGRVARPGAPLILTTNLAGHMAEFYDLYRETLLELGRLDRLAALDEHIARRGTADSAAARLEAAGFKVCRVDTDKFRMRFASGTALFRHYFIRLGFLPGWKAIAPPEALAPTFAALEAKLNAAAAARGELALTIPMACIEARKQHERRR